MVCGDIRTRNLEAQYIEALVCIARTVAQKTTEKELQTHLGFIFGKEAELRNLLNAQEARGNGKRIQVA